ncbi:MAG: hypothetical protein RLZ12_850 [Bacillota bacterium]
MVKLFIDPGHGGSDSGAVNGKDLEKDFTLSFALKLRTLLLSKYTVDITMSRTTDKTVSLYQRTNLANSINADYFFSWHINSGGGAGFESYIYNKSVPPSTVTKQRIIHSSIMEQIAAFNITDRGQKRNDFHVLRESHMDAILIETLFIDNYHNLQLLKTDSFVLQLVLGAAKGLAKALALPPK